MAAGSTLTDKEYAQQGAPGSSSEQTNAKVTASGSALDHGAGYDPELQVGAEKNDSNTAGPGNYAPGPQTWKTVK
jgi:hypothetical protein